MKTFISILVLCISLSINAQEYENGFEYLQFLDEQQEDIPRRMWRYTKAIAHSRSDRAVENKKDQLVQTIEKAYKKIENAPGYKDDVFKNQVLKRLQYNMDLLNDDYEKIIDMKAVAEQSYDAMEAYMLAQEMADEKMEEIQMEYEKNYYAYANTHNIQILEEESDLGKKMELSNQVFKYYKEMYLVYFKVQINEIYLIDALNTNNINALQQNTNALSSSSQEGLDILKTLEPYNSDKSLIELNQKNFEFFAKEANEVMPKVIEFLILGEDVKKAQETLEKTSKKKRTKEQIDNFNALVNKYNAALKEYNRTNASINRERNLLGREFNEVNQAFLSRHIPKD